MSLTEIDAGGQSVLAGPLSGMTVLDLTRVLAGPYCTMVLADLGARVIKVEQPGTRRRQPRLWPVHNGASAYFASLNRGKEIDRARSEDRPMTGRFSRSCWPLPMCWSKITGPARMEKLGFGWDELHRHYPRLIYAAASGFGHTGPYAKRAAYDMVVQAMGGIMSVTGHPGQPPMRVGTSVGDITAGLFTAIGVNAALFHRAADRRGDQDRRRRCWTARSRSWRTPSSRYAATGEVAGPHRRAASLDHAIRSLRGQRTAGSSSPPATSSCS